MIENLFKEMYEYLDDTKSVFGTWNTGGSSKRDNLITIIKRYDIKAEVDDIFLSFERYIEENNLEKIDF